jgi:2-iminobutanoate/2-iminopropanoate deaminase
MSYRNQRREVSLQARRSVPERRRTSVYTDGFQHSNPIPAACRVDNVVYSSLIHGVDRSRDAGSATLEEQAELMFSRLRDVVEAAGGSTDDVVKVTMWMPNRAEREAVNRFWLEMFPDEADRPARQTINAQLDGEQLIQCDFVAVVEADERGEGRS